jgi:hypothetical protein
MITDILTIVISILFSCLVIFFILKNKYIRDLYKDWDYRKYDIKRNIYSFVKDIIILILAVIFIIFVYTL